MEVLAIWIIITELPNIKMIVTFTKRVQIVNHWGGGGVGGVLDQYLGVGEPLRV